MLDDHNRLPDRSCVYHIMLMYMRPGDEFRLRGESLPYARYFSFQTYAISHYKSDGALRDIDVVTDHGPNVYRDLPAAVRGDKQGGWTRTLVCWQPWADSGLDFVRSRAGRGVRVLTDRLCACLVLCLQARTRCTSRPTARATTPT